MIGTSVMKDLSKAGITVMGYHSMKSKISKKDEIYESLSPHKYKLKNSDLPFHYPFKKNECSWQETTCWSIIFYNDVVIFLYQIQFLLI